LLGLASAAWASTALSKPAGASAEFEFKLGVNTPDTHPLTLRIPRVFCALYYRGFSTGVFKFRFLNLVRTRGMLSRPSDLTALQEFAAVLQLTVAVTESGPRAIGYCCDFGVRWISALQVTNWNVETKFIF
jgi:hypothetical protein